MIIFNNWVFNLVLSILFVVVFTQFFKVATKKSSNDGALTVIAQLISGLSILVLIPFFSWQFPTDWKIWFFLLLAIVFYAINDRLHTTTRKNLDISTENITRQLSKVFLIIIGLIIFKEEFVLLKILGGLIIIISNMLLFVKKKSFVFDKYIVLQMISVLCFTIAIALDVGISNNFNLPVYISLTLVVPALLISLIERISIKKIKQEYIGGDKSAIWITGIAWGLSILFGLRAYILGDVITVSPLTSLSVLLNVLLAYIFLGEKESLLRKIISAIGIIIGVLLITLG